MFGIKESVNKLKIGDIVYVPGNTALQRKRSFNKKEYYVFVKLTVAPCVAVYLGKIDKKSSKIYINNSEHVVNSVDLKECTC